MRSPSEQSNAKSLSIEWLNHIGNYNDYCAINGIDPRVPLMEGYISVLESKVGQQELINERLNGERIELRRLLEYAKSNGGKTPPT